MPLSPTPQPTVLPTLGGDISGTLDAVTVAKVQGRAYSAAAPTTNDILKFVAGAWTPGTLTAADVGAVSSIAAGTGLNGGTITSTGTISMPAVGPGAGTVGGATSYLDSITLDAQGRVTAVSSIAGTPVLNTRQVIAGTGLAGGGALSGDVTLTMPSMGPGAMTTGGGGAYIASITTDAQGRISALTTGTPGGGHIISSGSTPTIAAGGGGANASITGNDTAGVITCDVNAIGSTICTVTFATPYTTAPNVVASPLSNVFVNMPSGHNYATVFYITNITTTGFSICSGNPESGSPSVSAPGSKWSYIVIG